MKALFRKSCLALFTLAILLSSFLFVAQPAFAQDPQPFVYPPGQDPITPENQWGGICTYNGIPTIQGLQCVLARILSIAVTSLGFIGFIMLIVGSFKYLLSGGNSKGTGDAKNTMTFAVAGLVLALSAFFALNIIADFTGVKTILNFQIPNFAVGGAQQAPLAPVVPATP